MCFHSKCQIAISLITICWFCQYYHFTFVLSVHRVFVGTSPGMLITDLFLFTKTLENSIVSMMFILTRVYCVVRIYIVDAMQWKLRQPFSCLMSWVIYFTHSYLIDPTTDPEEHFIVQPNGDLEVNNALDRETVAFYELKVWAVDNGKAITFL